MVTILKPFGQTLGVQATCASKCKHFVSKGMYVECTQTQERKRELGSMHAIVHAVRGTHARNFRRWKPRLACCGTVACVAASSATPGTGTFSHRSSARAQKSRTGQDGRLWKAVEGCGVDQWGVIKGKQGALMMCVWLVQDWTDPLLGCLRVGLWPLLVLNHHRRRHASRLESGVKREPKPQRS